MIGLFLVSMSLGLSNFAAAIGIGLSGVSARTRFKTGLAFGFFEAAMPIVGLLIGRTVAGGLGETGHGIGALLLVGTGAYVIWKGRHENGDARDSTKRAELGFRHLLVAGFALSFS